MFPPGSFLTTLVNITGAGPVGAFDLSLNYNLTQGPNVLNIVQGTLVGGLFDPNKPPAGCSVLVARQDILLPGSIRFAVTFVGGCTVNGNGILLSLIFQVVGVGVGAIDIVQQSTNGGVGTTIVGANSALVPFAAFNSIFRNKPGIPPLAEFTVDPVAPIIGDTIQFNATSSYDPDSLLSPNRGIQAEPVIYDFNGDSVYEGATDTTIFGTTPSDGTPLQGNRNLVFWDTNHNGVWNPGESVVYSGDAGLIFHPIDHLIYGALPPLGTTLNLDSSIRYVNIHDNSIWDDGYVWDFADGTPLQPGNVTNHVFRLTPLTPASGTYPVKLVVWDSDDQLATEKTLSVSIGRGIQQASSLNWSGYVVSGPPGSVSDAKGSWVVPSVVEPCSSTNTYSAFWVGIDGWNSPTVEQTGTESSCINGKPNYFAWYEFFPRNEMRINSVPIRPGDVVSAEVQFSNNKFNVSIINLTLGVSFDKSIRVNGAARSSAEWIAEAPSSRAGILPLANFGTVVFGQDYSGVPGTCMATVDGSTGTIGSFGSAASAITMSGSSTLGKAQPTRLTPDRTSFTVTWRAPA